MENNFNFALATTTEKTKVGKVEKDVWKKSYTNAKGEIVELCITDTALVTSASRIDALLAMKEFTSLGVCFELSVFADNKDKIGFKSVADIGEKLFGLKSSTATQYARVGKHFVIKSEDERKGVNYHLVEDVAIYNPSVTNLVQCLSIIDEKADNPTEEFYKALAEDKLHIGGTLANLKKELKAYKSGAESDGVIADVEAKEISSEPINNDISKAFSAILAEAEKLTDNDKKAKAVELIAELTALFA